MTEPLLGRSINRLEDERLVRGRGRYIADLAAPNALHGVVVRSTHAHARIIGIRVDAARQIPGVAAVLTGLELASDNIGPLPCAVTNIPGATPLVVPPCHALARAVVRYVGEPVAFVVAESAESARDAAEAVVVDYEPLQPVISMADAVLLVVPSIWPETKNNIAFQWFIRKISGCQSEKPTLGRRPIHVCFREKSGHRILSASRPFDSIRTSA
jgi:aerobic carbon-monoxide dehydrogenase large subunit